MRFRTIMVVALVLLGGVQQLAAQQPGAEGIKVHGDWTIEVRNPDGTLVKRHVFKNALTSEGKLILTVLLGRTSGTSGTARVTFGRWFVTLLPLATGSDPCAADGKPGCRMSEGQGLTVSTATGSEVVFTGDFKADASGQIGVVGTGAELLVNGNPTDDTWSFSQKSLESAISITAGQIVQVKVVVSFS